TASMTRDAEYELAPTDEDSSLCGADSDDDERSLPLLHENGSAKKNGLVKIDLSHADVMPSVADRFPKEPKKAFVAMGMLFIAAMLNDIVLAYIHEQVPETAPLPDVFFRNTPYLPWALVASEYAMLTAFGGLVVLGLFHRHRWILLRRVSVIAAILYFGRSVSMFVTQVPVADAKYYCSPKLKASEINYSLLAARAFRLVSGVGLNVSGKQTLCGDYIYSGHTLVLVTSYLFIKEYSPRRWWLLHNISWLLSASGVLLLLLSRGHYTVDVLIAYWISTRVFWIYHTCAAYPALK
uniref:Sphingomyelin synthase-like domain-containing protein n=1 Tax=Plectus sambesii TaxID=2011161 RepID=A0A914UP58_9BILA